MILLFEHVPFQYRRCSQGQVEGLTRLEDGIQLLFCTQRVAVAALDTCGGHSSADKELDLWLPFQVLVPYCLRGIEHIFYESEEFT